MGAGWWPLPMLRSRISKKSLELICMYCPDPEHVQRLFLHNFEMSQKNIEPMTKGIIVRSSKNYSGGRFQPLWYMHFKANNQVELEYYINISMCASVLDMLSRFSHGWLFATLRTVICQAPLSMRFSGHKYWSGLPCPLPGDLFNPRTELTFLTSSAWTGRFITTSATWEALL